MFFSDGGFAMYACRISHDRDRFLLRPTFATLSSFWLLLAIPISSILLGTLIWLNVDAPKNVEVPAFVFPLFLLIAGLAIACLVLAAGDAPFPLVLDREKGLQHGREWIPTADMTSLRVETDPEVEIDEHYHLWLHLRNGNRVELKRSLWILESDHDRVCSIGNELASFLHVPLIDCSFRPTQTAHHYSLGHGPATSSR